MQALILPERVMTSIHQIPKLLKVTSLEGRGSLLCPFDLTDHMTGPAELQISQDTLTCERSVFKHCKRDGINYPLHMHPVTVALRQNAGI